MNKVREQIPEEKIHGVRQTVRRNKYENDSRADSPEQVRRFHAQRLADEYDIGEEDMVLEVLRIETIT